MRHFKASLKPRKALEGPIRRYKALWTSWRLTCKASRALICACHADKLAEKRYTSRGPCSGPWRLPQGPESLPLDLLKIPRLHCPPLACYPGYFCTAICWRPSKPRKSSRSEKNKTSKTAQVPFCVQDRPPACKRLSIKRSQKTQKRRVKTFKQDRQTDRQTELQKTAKRPGGLRRDT